MTNPDDFVIVPRCADAVMYAAAAGVHNQMFAGGSMHGADDEQIWAAMIAARPAAPWDLSDLLNKLAEIDRAYLDEWDFAQQQLARANAAEREAARMREALNMWWVGIRPLLWTQAQHLEHPRVNCKTDGECALADLAAALAPHAGEE